MPRKERGYLLHVYLIAGIFVTVFWNKSRGYIFSSLNTNFRCGIQTKMLFFYMLVKFSLSYRKSQISYYFVKHSEYSSDAQIYFCLVAAANIKAYWNLCTVYYVSQSSQWTKNAITKCHFGGNPCLWQKERISSGYIKKQQDVSVENYWTVAFNTEFKSSTVMHRETGIKCIAY